MKNLFAFFLILSFFSCGKDSTDGNFEIPNTNLVHGTYLIKVPDYTYQNQIDCTIHIYGDTKVFTFIAPSCPSQGCPPEKFYENFSQLFEIHWTDPGIKYQAVGVFTVPIGGSYASERELGNSNSLIWTWHTGMVSTSTYAKAGVVRFGDGRDVHNGAIDYDSEPTLLKFDTLYYFGIWGWSEDGTELKFTSNEMRMRIRIAN